MSDESYAYQQERESLAKAAPQPAATTFHPKSITCRECRRAFLWSAEEQQFFADNGLKNEPKRCRSCRTQKPSRPTTETVRGKVKWFNVSKGYGFITPDGPAEGDVYVHFSQIFGRGFMSLAIGQVVEFGIVKAEKGPAAVNVRTVNPTEESNGNR